MSEVKAHITGTVWKVEIGVGQEGVNGGGSWSLGDAAHDAGRVLAVTAGVLLIAAAVLGPLVPEATPRRVE